MRLLFSVSQIRTLAIENYFFFCACKAKRDKKKLKREGIAGQLNDEDEDASPEDELFG